MRTSDFDYELPQELIAQTPVEPRDHCRLMVVRADGSAREDHLFYEVINELHAGDCMVINETRVIPARLLGVKEETGVPVEVLLLRRQNANEWEALVRPGRRLKPGTWCSFGDGLLRCEILGNVPETGGRFVRFSYDGVFEELLDRICQAGRLSCCTDCRTAFHGGTAGSDPGKGRVHCAGASACRSWHIQTGQGRQCG